MLFVSTRGRPSRVSLSNQPPYSRVPGVLEEVVGALAGDVEIPGVAGKKESRRETEDVPADQGRDLVVGRQRLPVARQVHEEGAVGRVGGVLGPAGDEVFQGMGPPVFGGEEARAGLGFGSGRRLSRGRRWRRPRCLRPGRSAEAEDYKRRPQRPRIATRFYQISRIAPLHNYKFGTEYIITEFPPHLSAREYRMHNTSFRIRCPNARGAPKTRN